MDVWPSLESPNFMVTIGKQFNGRRGAGFNSKVDHAVRVKLQVKSVTFGKMKVVVPFKILPVSRDDISSLKRELNLVATHPTETGGPEEVTRVSEMNRGKFGATLDFNADRSQAEPIDAGNIDGKSKLLRLSAMTRGELGASLHSKVKQRN